MRTIKFRGKRVDTKEWVYGYYGLSLDGSTFIIEATFSNDSGRRYFFDTDVIPETVGQFTGLTDKNGKEIYEGDIVVVWYFEPDAGTEDGWTTFKAFVEYRENEMCFVINVHGKKLVNVDVSKFVEIIGNIHDNPELLNVQ